MVFKKILNEIFTILTLAPPGEKIVALMENHSSMKSVQKHFSQKEPQRACLLLRKYQRSFVLNKLFTLFYCESLLRSAADLSGIVCETPLSRDENGAIRFLSDQMVSNNRVGLIVAAFVFST